MTIFGEAAAVEAMARALHAYENDFDGAATFDQECTQSSDLRRYWICSARSALAALKPFLGGMQRLKDCEMSLAIFDVGRSSEYWERHPSPDKGGE